MSLLVHDLGDTVVLRADFTNLENLPAVPEDLEGWIRAPDGSVTMLSAFEVDIEDPSIWTTTHVPDQSGRWFWRISFSGDELPQVEEHGFLVREQYVEEGS